MDAALQQTALMRFLQKNSPLYYGKVDEIDHAVKGWLSYIPQSFPHYTRHTIEHSIEIVRQLSSLLFIDRDPDQGVVYLSPTEAYILVASAYLHDAGMVASDKEKSEILLSDEWREWTTSSGGASRWQQIQQFRQGNQPGDESLKHFLADIQTRFLLAEFIRRSHHLRVKEVLTLHQSSLGRFAFDDPHLLRAINEVCVAHGLRKHELEDRERFPDRRDIREDQVNLCFLVILLRIADLLDISHDRACPLLLNAASPLPADSRAHWTQYQRITHRLTAPDKIEVTAECENQEEHRYLRDWFQWLEDEVNNAAVLASHWQRHSNWRTPVATLLGSEPTIKIQKAPGSTYIFGEWKLELDHEAIFERLVYDVHDKPEAFIRELIQNALDASRCRMYADYMATGQEPPEYPTQFPEELRQKYPVHLTLEEREFINDLSGESEKVQVLVIEDFGMGMDKEIIQKYFLQIGRSYYLTDEFRRHFKFYPTSRFGVGFLSVFAVSDHVTVETYKPENNDGPLRLILTGPRNYLLLDQGTRTPCGTRIDIVLRNPFAPGNLTDLLSGWCRRAEFPIQVSDLGTETTIFAERQEDFVYEMPLVTDPNAKFAVRAFPINRAGIEGELYIFAYIKEGVESWVDWRVAQEYPDTHPQAQRLQFPESIICINGISFDKRNWAPLAARLDYRGPFEHIPLSRTGTIKWSEWRDSSVNSRWQEIIDQHIVETPLAQGEGGNIYKLKLASLFPMLDYWENKPGLIRVFYGRQKHFISLDELRNKAIIITFLTMTTKINDNRKATFELDELVPTLLTADLSSLPHFLGNVIFSERFLYKIKWLNYSFLVLYWHKGKSTRNILFENFPDDLSSKLIISFSISYGTSPGTISSIPILLLNKRHIFIKWVEKFKDACYGKQLHLGPEHFENILRLIHINPNIFGEPYFVHCVQKLKYYLHELKKLPGLPEDLKPPNIELAPEMFKSD